MKGSVPGPIQSTFPPHPFLQHFSRGNSTGAGCPAPAKGHGTGQHRCSSQAEHKPSCGQLAHVSIQVHFLNEDQETYGLTPLFCLCEAGPGEPRLVQFFTYAKLHSPKPTVPPSPSPIIQSCMRSRSPSLQLTATSSAGATSDVTPHSMAKCCLGVSESLGRVAGIPKETSGQGAVCTPSSCDQQDKPLWPQKRLMPGV